MAASEWIHGDTFSEAASVVRKIEQATELVIGALETRFIVIVLLAGYVHAEFESVNTPYPAHGIAKCEGVLRKVPGGGADLSNTHDGSWITQTAGIEIEQPNLRDAVI